MKMKIQIKLVPVSGQDSLQKLKALLEDLPKLLVYLMGKMAQEVKEILEGLGMGSLAASVEAFAEGIMADQAILNVESGRKAILARKQALAMKQKGGPILFRRKAKAVSPNLILDRASEKIFNEPDPLDLSEKV
jgi:hypothetical protein